MARLWGAITACSRCVRWLDQCGPGECGAGDGAGFPNAGIGVPRRRHGHDQCLVRVAGRSADASYSGPDTERNKNAGQDRSACAGARSEEHTSELQSLMRISYAVFCLKKKTTYTTHATH